MYGEPTNPVPYIVAAFGLAFAAIIGYWLYMRFQKKTLDRRLNTLKELQSHE